MVSLIQILPHLPCLANASCLIIRGLKKQAIFRIDTGIIESLFGNFKHIIERSPQADMNRTVLLISALCGKLTDSTVTQALRQASQSDIEAWEKKYISYTVRKKRHAFFNNGYSQNTGKYKAA